MEAFFMKALQLILGLVILVIVHEFGHYILARILGVKVDKFYLFFNPWFSLLKYYPDKGKLELIAWTKEIRTPDPADPENPKLDKVEEEPHALWTLTVGKPHDPMTNGKPNWRSTIYGLGWLPLGGYCDINGMVDETTSADQLSSEPKPWEFRSKAAWKRFLIIVAGVTFNFLLAIAIYVGIALHWGDKTILLSDVEEGMDYISFLHEAGFQDGDRIVEVNHTVPSVTNERIFWDMVQPGSEVKVVRNYTDTVNIKIPSFVLDSIAGLRTSPMVMRVPAVVNEVNLSSPAERAGLLAGDRIVRVGDVATPSFTEFSPTLRSHAGKEVVLAVERDGSEIEIPVKVKNDSTIGVRMRLPQDIYRVQEIEYTFFPAIARGCQMGVEKLTTYVSSLKILFTKQGATQVGGFGTLGSLYPEKWNWHDFWSMTAFLSVVLAFMNIIPIPGLDGGYIMFIFWEMITGRKVPDKYVGIANMIGFMFLILLMVYANANDVIRLFR